MRTGVRNERFEVSAEYSTLTFFVETKTAVVYGKATGLAGYVEAAWNPDGSMKTDSDPTMHLEFPVENVRSGNDLRDREMWKLVDSKRFPTIAADLLSIRPSATRPHTRRPDASRSQGSRTRTRGCSRSVAMGRT